MNLVVRPEGTAELDDRSPATTVQDVFDDRRTVAINITTDNGRTVLGRVHSEPDASTLSTVANQMMLRLTGRYFALSGPVVFTELDPDLAHQLLELARD